MADKLIFPIGFDLEEGVKKAGRDWKNHYRKRLQDAIDSRPLKVKIDFESKGIDTKEFKRWMVLSREAEKLERERIKNAKEWQKVADQAAMAETRRANATNESNARIERANRKAEASETRKRDAVERTNEAYKRQGGYLQRLFQRMVAYASVTQAFSFIRNIREVTAQFELQRVALGSIIGDLNEANAMFEQIKAAAVKSPFQIKELVTYTKQLAAYKIETDELFETTQKLADVSAGLGVGMERLVLAYGQIRATGYLRASEVRQLTEAGIPIVEELAKKMSELRGETVSAAEVMGMISERAISFSMVKEVFDDMTSAGGMFYKMQEKQAETLAGQWSNLQDAISIMYEEIGNTETAQNGIKGMIGLVKSLAENWRDVYSVAQSLSVAMGVYYVAMKNATVASKALTIAEATRLAVENKQMIIIPKWLAFFDRKNRLYKVSIVLEKALALAQLKTATATNVLSKGFWKLTTAMLSNPYTAVLAALVGITIAIVKFAAKTKTTQERIDDLNKSVASFNELANPKNGIKKLIDEFDELSRKANKTEKEQKRLNQVTRALAESYPSAINGVKEYGQEVGVAADKVKELYQSELKLRQDRIRQELKSSEEEYAKLEALYNDYISRINKGTYLQPVVNPNTDEVTYYEKAYTEEQLAALGNKALEVADKMRPLATTIKNAKIALGELNNEGANAVDTFNTWQKELASITEGKNLKGEGIRVFDDESISQINKLTDATARVAEEYDKLAKEKKEVDKALKSEGAKADKDTYAKLQERLGKINEGMSGLYGFLKKYGALDLIKSDDKTKKSAEQALKDELAAVEKIYKRYQDLRKLKSETDTQSILAKEFKGVSLTTLSKAYSPEQMIEVYQKALAEAQRLGKKDLVLEIQTKIGEFNVAEEQRKLEKNLKKLSDDLSRTKTAKEFFDRMLGLTGDKQLSATLTMSVYGEGGEDLGTKLAQQTADAFKAKYKGINFSKTAISDKGVFDWETILMEGEEDSFKLGEELYEQFLKDVEAGKKANAEWLTDLQKTYQKAFTFEERRTQVMKQEAENRKKIEQDTSLTPEAKAKLIEASKSKEAKDIASINLEEFKASEDYIKMFEDFDRLATPTVERLIAKLRKFIATNKELNATDLKNLTEQINKLEEGLIKRNPFEGLTKGIERVRQARQKLSASSFKDEKEYTDALDEQEAGYDDIEQALKGIQDEFSKAEQTIRGFGDALGIAEDSDMGVFLNGIADAFGYVQKAIVFADLAMKLFDGTIKTFLKSNPLGWVALIAGGVMGAISAISNAKVRKADKEIERQQDLIDKLEKSHERLEKQIEKTFGSDYLKNYNDRLANLYAQQEAYLKQAEKERSKGKKADQDKIDDYEDAARNAAESMVEMQQEVQERMLGTDLASAARDFANAWIDAYKEFGSTTDAMKAKFQDMIQNMIVESFAAKVVQSALSDIFTEIDNMTKDGVLDMSEASKIADMTEVAVGNIDVGMTNLKNALSQAGISVRGMGSDLTGISRDIATASEESILGLAAGINTQNLYISQVPPKLDVIIGLLQGGNLTQGSAITLQDLVTIQNQHLSHLPSIAQHTADTVAECKRTADACEVMVNKLNSVIKPQGTEATHRVATILSNK